MDNDSADKERLEAFEMWIWRRMHVKDQLGKQSIKCRSTAESTRKQEQTLYNIVNSDGLDTS